MSYLKRERADFILLCKKKENINDTIVPEKKRADFILLCKKEGKY